MFLTLQSVSRLCLKSRLILLLQTNFSLKRSLSLSSLSKLLVFLIVPFLFVSCGGGGNSSDNSGDLSSFNKIIVDFNRAHNKVSYYRVI
jgi:hypothetical protein